jgi:hypothetical protein
VRIVADETSGGDVEEEEEEEEGEGRDVLQAVVATASVK